MKLQKNKKLIWSIIFIILIIVSCDQDAFKHLQNAAEFFKLGMYDQALIELKTSNRFLKDTPEFQKSMYKYLMWGIIALKEGDQAEAIKNFSLALELDPKEEQIRFILSSLYLQQNNFTQAVKLFENPEYLDITYGAPDYLQGIKYYQQGNINKAIYHFEKTLKTLNEEFIYFSDNPSQKLVVEQLRLVLYSMLGEGYLQLKNYSASIKNYTKALEQEKQNIILDAKLKIAMLSYQATREPKNSGLYATIAYYYTLLNLNEKAILFYQKALELYPRSAPAWLGLATVYKNSFDYKNAKNALEKALSYSTEPKMIASIYLTLGQIYIAYDNLNSAKEIFSKAYKLDPENTSIENDLSLTLSLSQYKQNPNHIQNNIKLGELYLERKDLNSALQYFNLAEKLDKKNNEAFIGKAKVYYLQKKYDYALSLYKKVLQSENENSKALYGLTDVYLGLEKYDLAISTLKKILLNDPENVLLRHKLAYLYFYSGQNSEAAKEFDYVKNHINNEEMIVVIEKIIEVIS